MMTVLFLATDVEELLMLISLSIFLRNINFKMNVINSDLI